MTYRRIAIVMAGGSGERFWPLSRKLRPKQLLKLADENLTLIEQTITRLGSSILPEDIYIATAGHLVESMKCALPDIDASRILAEPHKRNTVGCLVWVAAKLLAESPDARETVSMAILAADHRVTTDVDFRRTMDAALDRAEATQELGTIGIKPDRPETGYGYIELGADFTESDGIRLSKVNSFREKPTQDAAMEYISAGNFLWNSGTFFWTLNGFLTELESAGKDLYDLTFAIATALKAGDDAKAAELFATCRNISIDFALMENAKSVFVAEAAFDWDDVGAWDALERSFEPDSLGNVAQGEVISLDSKGCIFVNDNPVQTLSVLGMQDVVVVVTGDAILVMPKSRVQETKRFVEELNNRGIAKT